MDKLFIIQLITSFFVGGAMIAALSLLAEKSSEKIAGIVISLPSTIAISFFFIGWATSPEKIAEISPVIPAMEGGVMMFTVTYLYLSKLKIPKVFSMMLCTIGSLLIWSLFAFPIAITQLTNMWLSFAIYIVFGGIAYYLLTVLPKGTSNHKPLHYTTVQIIGRAIFAGSIITLAVFLSKVLDPFWGGVLSAFPAVFISTLTIVYWYYDSGYLFKVWKNAPMGSIIFTVYPFAAIYTFPAFGIWGGTLASYSVCLVVFWILAKFQHRN